MIHTCIQCLLMSTQSHVHVCMHICMYLYLCLFIRTDIRTFELRYTLHTYMHTNLIAASTLLNLSRWCTSAAVSCARLIHVKWSLRTTSLETDGLNVCIYVCMHVCMHVCIHVFEMQSLSPNLVVYAQCTHASSTCAPTFRLFLQVLLFYECMYTHSCGCMDRCLLVYIWNDLHQSCPLHNLVYMYVCACLYCAHLCRDSCV